MDAAFKPIGYLVSIRSRHGGAAWRAKFCPGSHEAFHVLKQWKEQFDDLAKAGCVFHSELVYAAVPSSVEPGAPS